MAVGEIELGDIECIAESVLGNVCVRIAVHAATRIGGDLLDLDDGLAEPTHRRRLHGCRDPLIERGNDRTGERRRRADFNRAGRCSHHRSALRTEWRQWLGRTRIAVDPRRKRGLGTAVIGMWRPTGNADLLIVLFGWWV